MNYFFSNQDSNSHPHKYQAYAQTNKPSHDSLHFMHIYDYIIILHGQAHMQNN